MRPETPGEALGLVIHRQLHPEHSGDGCCSFLHNDLVEGQDLVEGLLELGWNPPAPQVALPDSVPAGDPRTAAANIEDCPARTWATWHVLVTAGRDLSTEELNDRYEGMAERHPGLYPPMAWDSPRKRLSELERRGHVAQVRGPDGKAVLRKNRNNVGCTVWVARDALGSARGSREGVAA